MNFKNISELREFIRRYNSTSILQVGAKKCWHNWEMWNTKYSNSFDWLQGNTERNYIVRIMLLASSGNPHRHKYISVEEFNRLINAYHNLDQHTISDKYFLDNESETLLSYIKIWEKDNEKKIRNWSLNLSDILNLDLIRSHGVGLFAQRMVAFQNSGFGYPLARIQRTIKFIEILDQHSKENLSNQFLNCNNLSQIDYFRLFFTCFVMFGQFSSAKENGFCDFSKFPIIDNNFKSPCITKENIQTFIRKNSIVFISKEDHSFRNKVDQTLKNVSSFYHTFFYNYFLEFPLVDLGNEKFCLPDPISFIESCWNRVKEHIFQSSNVKKSNELLGSAFESYIEKILLPVIAPNSFERINEVKNSNSNNDKRADFLIKTLNAYIVLECKTSIMCADTSAYFQPDKLADLWYRIHWAVEQISVTIRALKLHDKPVIPLVLTYYDSIASATVFQEMVRETDYCIRMGISMPPVVYSLHEFEHWISDRSLNNWADLILSKQNAISPIQPDNKGHNYEHLANTLIDFG